MTGDKLYVYGRNGVEHSGRTYECPARCAGYDAGKGAYRRMAYKYDDVATEAHGPAYERSPGYTLTPSEACRAWRTAISRLADHGQVDAAEAGVEVGRELGWVEPDETVSDVRFLEALDAADDSGGENDADG